jgi:hypothetical protein
VARQAKLLGQCVSVGNPYSIENFITNGLRGYFPLLQAFWRYYLVGRIIVFAIAYVLVTGLGFFGWFLAIIIWVPYWLWSYATMWKSAVNTRYEWVAYLVRIGLYLEAVYLLFNPSLLTIAF